MKQPASSRSIIGHMGLVAAVVVATTGAAGAMSLPSTTSLPSTAGTATDGARLIEVRGGCGFGEHRGFFGGCRINHGWRGRIRRAETGLPRGCPPGMHRGFYGRCFY